MGSTVRLSEFSSSLQDYMEAILILNRQNKVARVKDIAKLLDVKSASVVGALKTLAQRGLLVHERYGYVELTPEGKRVAEQVLERHEVLIAFLHEVLGVNYEVAVRDACRIEHHLSEQTLRKLREYMAEKGVFESRC